MMDWPYMGLEHLRRFGFDKLAVVKVATSLGKSVYDMMQPQIDLQFPAHANARVVSAGLYRLAAAVELASPAHAKWTVRTCTYRDTGRVFLELEADNDLEAEQGLQCLRSVLEDHEVSLSLPGIG